MRWWVKAKLEVEELLVRGRLKAAPNEVSRPLDGDRERVRSSAGTDPDSGTVVVVPAVLALGRLAVELAGGSVNDTIGTDGLTWDCGRERVPPPNRFLNGEGMIRFATAR